jgi:hypothetical protein
MSPEQSALALHVTVVHDLQRKFCWLCSSIRSIAWESRSMKDALTIVVVISRDSKARRCCTSVKSSAQGRRGFPSADK